MFTSKGLALAISSFIPSLGPKNREIKQRKREPFLVLLIFGQEWENNTNFNQGRGRVTEILCKIVREIELLLPSFPCFRLRVRKAEGYG